jgi:iron complex outermembrane receptor protein
MKQLSIRQVIGFIIPLMLLSSMAFSQVVVTGTVADGTGEPLPSATITVKGTNTYAIADANGKFSLTTSEALPFSIVIKFLGYKTQEIEVYELEVPLEIKLLEEANILGEVTVTSRRREETSQDVPIPITAVGGGIIEDAGAFNVNRVKELVPSVQLYSSNPRNTGVNIRGLGSSFGLTNDGIDPGVGFYVDGVYYSRPAATTLDFVDIEQIEVLRGPQGTLYGKNTTAGSINITTLRPTFTPEGKFEVSYGNFGFIQAKASVSGKIANKLAGRLSFSGTQRNGLIENVATAKPTNTLNNQGVRGQLLYTPTSRINILLAADITSQRPDGYAQVYAGTAPTLRPAFRQFDNIIKDLNYTLPSTNPFDRKIDHDTPWKSGQDLGGASLNIDVKIGKGTLTSTTAWRFWNWDPSNDRDFTGLQALAKSQNPSRHEQFSQEIRYAGNINDKLSGVVGVYYIDQNIATRGVEESGKHQWRFSQTNNTGVNDTRWKTPGLLDGYGVRSNTDHNSASAALFGQLDWAITKKWHVLPGIRFNYDKKSVIFDRQTYGGLQTTDADLIAIKNTVYRNQSFNTRTENNNFSGQITTSYKVNDRINTFATYAYSFKPVGLNTGSLPTDTNGVVLLDLAVVKPEEVNHFELGIKTSPFANSTLNLTVFNTEIKDYQTLVQTAELGVNRGYLANAERVRVRGAELDASIKATKNLSFYGALTYTEGIYVSFTNAPLPLEETGKTIPVTTNGVTTNVQQSFKDVSGGELPGISKWAASVGGEFTANGKLFGNKGKFFIAADTYYRSKFSSSPSPSAYLNINEYAIVNARAGFRTNSGVSLIFWSRNLFDKNYFEQLLPAGGNAGHYVGVLGDQRTFGTTLRYDF